MQWLSLLETKWNEERDAASVHKASHRFIRLRGAREVEAKEQTVVPLKISNMYKWEELFTVRVLNRPCPIPGIPHVFRQDRVVGFEFIGCFCVTNNHSIDSTANNRKENSAH